MQGREEEGVRDPAWSEERQPLGQRAQRSAGPLCPWRVMAERARAFLQTAGAVGWMEGCLLWVATERERPTRRRRGATG